PGAVEVLALGLALVLLALLLLFLFVALVLALDHTDGAQHQPQGRRQQQCVRQLHTRSPVPERCPAGKRRGHPIPGGFAEPARTRSISRFAQIPNCCWAEWTLQ